jgi:hypothetical protein
MWRIVAENLRADANMNKAVRSRAEVAAGFTVFCLWAFGKFLASAVRAVKRK